MPYTEKQRKLFHAAEENAEVAQEHGMSHSEARKLADEADEKPVKKPVKKGFVDLKPVFGD